jgi:hypothetical protein
LALKQRAITVINDLPKQFWPDPELPGRCDSYTKAETIFFIWFLRTAKKSRSGKW